MTFYVLNLSADKKVIGPLYPQINKFVKSKDLIQKLNQIDNSVFLSDSNNRLDYFILNDSAKITDIISTSIINGNNGILISERFKNILDDNLLLCSHKYYPTTLKHRGIFYNNYFFMHLLPFYNQIRIVEYADISSSSFYIGNLIGSKIHEITFNTIEEIQETRQEVFKNDSNLVYSGCFTFNKQLSNIDLFVIHFCDYNIYISERLKHKLYAEQISGLGIINTNKIIINS